MIKVNSIQIKPTRFPDKTTQIWNLPDEVFSEKLAKVEWDFDYESELIELAQVKDLLDENKIKADLYLDFLPYGRQDKYVRNHNTFALYSFAKLLNALSFDRVYCLDPHSETATRLINNFIPYYPIKTIKNLKIKLEADMLCYPDSGAKYKYSQILGEPAIFADKIRDQITGKITSLKIGTDSGTLINTLSPDFGSKLEKILIVDDLCDGGTTFTMLAKELYRIGAKEVNLFVTHGIFSKGLHVLYEAGIERVFTNKGEAGILQGNLTYKSYGEK